MCKDWSFQGYAIILSFQVEGGSRVLPSPSCLVLSRLPERRGPGDPGDPVAGPLTAGLPPAEHGALGCHVGGFKRVLPPSAWASAHESSSFWLGPSPGDRTESQMRVEAAGLDLSCSSWGGTRVLTRSVHRRLDKQVKALDEFSYLIRSHHGVYSWVHSARSSSHISSNQEVSHTVLLIDHID